MVEFGPDSLWYETSLSIAARALKVEVKTEYHTLMHPPGRIREVISELGLDLTRLEEKRLFRLWTRVWTRTSHTGPPV